MVFNAGFLLKYNTVYSGTNFLFPWCHSDVWLILKVKCSLCWEYRLRFKGLHSLYNLNGECVSTNNWMSFQGGMCSESRHCHTSIVIWKSLKIYDIKLHRGHAVWFGKDRYCDSPGNKHQSCCESSWTAFYREGIFHLAGK